MPQPALETRDLTIRFGGHVAVDRVSCAFHRGTLTANDLTVPWHGPAQAHHVPLPPRRAARPSV